MPNPFFSIIVPLHNNVDTVEDTIRSIIDQSFNNWECILIDDNSTDNTLLFINSLIEYKKKFQYIKHMNPLVLMLREILVLKKLKENI